jgi:hypothetical protein
MPRFVDVVRRMRPRGILVRGIGLCDMLVRGIRPPGIRPPGIRPPGIRPPGIRLAGIPMRDTLVRAMRAKLIVAVTGKRLAFGFCVFRVARVSFVHGRLLSHHDWRDSPPGG